MSVEPKCEPAAGIEDVMSTDDGEPAAEERKWSRNSSESFCSENNEGACQTPKSSAGATAGDAEARNQQQGLAAAVQAVAETHGPGCQAAQTPPSVEQVTPGRRPPGGGMSKMKSLRPPTLAPLSLGCLRGPGGRGGAMRVVPDPLQSAGFDRGDMIGSGTFSKVYKVTRRSDGQVFAGKHISSADEEVARLARAEHAIMAELSHDAIVRMEALFENGCGDLWLCMELCVDGCLQRHVESSGAVCEERGRQLLLQLVEGVDYLHQKRIVHRDLKPDNLFLADGATSLRIGDFNCARKLECGTESTVMLTHRGTPLYAAPEIRFCLLWNERVDVWAIGLCAFYMLEGTLPFNVEKTAAVEALKAGKLPDISWKSASRSATSLILQCLVVDMRMRPAPMELREHAFFRRGGSPGRRSLRHKSATFFKTFS